MRQKDIKKIEYRQDPDGNDVVDFILYDGTKEKVRVKDIDAELERIETKGKALLRRRRVLTKLKQTIANNDPVPERAAKLKVELTNE